MKRSNMKETVNNTVTLPGDHLASKSLLQRSHPPYDDFTFEDAVRVVPLLSWIDCDWLSAKVRNILGDIANRSVRRPIDADVLCNHGMGDVVKLWFEDESWACRTAIVVLLGCESAEALREASAFVLSSSQRMALTFAGFAKLNGLRVNPNGFKSTFDNSKLRHWSNPSL